LSISKDQAKINDFVRRYVDRSQVIHWNTIKLKGTSKTHQDMVYNVCWWLYKNGITFSTEVKFRTGYTPDIVCPTYVKPLIEIRYSESDERTAEKYERIPAELIDQIIYVDANKPFTEKMIQ
jgi:hypothetical protein